MSALLLLVVLLAAGLAAHLLVGDARAVPRDVGVAAGDERDAVRRLAGTVSVVVPARNEVSTLPLLLASLQVLRNPPREVLVVDDGSDDGTVELARAARVTVLEAGRPAPGWTGKAWACHRGASVASGSTLLFLDADTVLAPDALDGLLALLTRHGGLVSVQPHHHVVRAYEQLSAYFNVVGVLASGSFSRWRPDPPMAYGPVLLTSVADYERAGGHTAVRAEILDDASLAAAYARAGSSVRCFLGGRGIAMRMYPGGPRQLVEGWSKNIASGAGTANRWSALGAGAWVASHWAVTVGAALLLLSPLTGAGPPSAGAVTPYVVAWLAVALQLQSLLRRVGTFGWWTWALFPVPLLAFTLIFARSALLTTVRREVTWRGRRIAVSPPGRGGH